MHTHAHRPARDIGALVRTAGECLRQSDGHLYYIGTQLFGIVGFIDSSEMVSTFGSSPREVRGFVEGGWAALQNKAGMYPDHPRSHYSGTPIKLIWTP